MLKDDQDCKMPILLALQCLSKTEMAYAPIEEEALALTWGLDHYHWLIMGAQVVVRTDHKPLHLQAAFVRTLVYEVVVEAPGVWFGSRVYQGLGKCIGG